MTSQELLNPQLAFWAFQTIAMLITAWLLPGLKVSGPIPAFITVIALALVNAKIWDAALFFSVPDAMTTQAIVLLVANALIFWVVVKLLPGIEIDGVFSAVAAPVLFTVTSLFLSVVAKDVDWNHVLEKTKEVAQQVKDFVEASGIKIDTGTHANQPVKGFER